MSHFLKKFFPDHQEQFQNQKVQKNQIVKKNDEIFLNFNGVHKIATEAGFFVIFKSFESVTYRHIDGLEVSISVELHSDDRRWIHIVASRLKKKKYPSFKDFLRIRNTFLKENIAIIFLMKNIDKKTNLSTHIWCCIDSFDIPDSILGSIE